MNSDERGGSRAPERLWVRPKAPFGLSALAPDSRRQDGDVEYVRADLAVTAIRTACVKKVRAMGQQWYADAKKRGAAFSDKGRLAETIAKELESLTLDQVQEKR